MRGRTAFATATASRSPCDSRPLCSVAMLLARWRRLGSGFSSLSMSWGNSGHTFDERAGGGCVPPADSSAVQSGGDPSAQAPCAQIVAIMPLAPCVKCSCVRACRCRCITTTMTVPPPRHDYHRSSYHRGRAYYHRGMPQSRTHKWTSEVRIEAPIATESVRTPHAAQISTQL